MSAIFQVLGSYQVFTNLFPGIFLGLAINWLFNIRMFTSFGIRDLMIAYFFGFFINRVGSLVIQPLLGKTKFIKDSNYADFIFACHSDPKINVLSETSNYFRSMVAALSILLFIKTGHILNERWKIIITNWEWLTVTALLILMLFSYRKQFRYINERVEAAKTMNSSKGKTKFYAGTARGKDG